MTEPAVVALRALYRLTQGDTNTPVPLTPALQSSMGAVDLMALMGDLVHRGLIRSEPPNLVFLTPTGVRAMFVRLAYEERGGPAEKGAPNHESQDILIDEPEESHGDDEVDLGSIMDIVREGQARGRGESGIRPAPKSDPAPATERLDGLHAELDGLMKELALSAELSIGQWTQALELRAEVSRLLETIRRIVQPRSAR